MSPTDPLAHILRAVADGDQIAAARLVEHLEGPVRAVCSHLGSGENVDDLVQESLLRTLQSAATFKGQASVRTWALRIARNVCVDDVRARQRQRRLTQRLISQRVETAVPSVGVTHHLLSSLDPAQRDAFTLTQVGGLSYEETAEALGIPLGTVRSRVARARRALQDLDRATQQAPIDSRTA